MQQECNWTGFYIGAHVGYGWNDYKWVDADTAATSPGEPPEIDTSGPSVMVEGNAEGVIAGGTLGYNYQFGRHFVIGVEGEFSFSDVSDTTDVHDEERTFADRFETDSNWVGTFALRLGFAWHKLLFYAKGGGAVTDQDYSLNHHVFASLEDEENAHTDRFSADQTWVSPMAGGGLEYMITCHWTLKAEYQCLFWGKDDITGTMVEDATGPERETFEVDLKNQHTVKVGLNYKF